MGYGQLRRSPGSATSLRVLVYFAHPIVCIKNGVLHLFKPRLEHTEGGWIEARIPAGGRTFSLSRSSQPVQEADSTWSAPGAMGADSNGLTL